MIDIERLHKLEKEVQNTHDQIIRQVWLVHHVIGRDIRSNCGDVLINIDKVYEEFNKKINIPYVVIESHNYDWLSNEWLYSTVFIKKELFDMTEEELKANKERLSKELEETNKIQVTAGLSEIFAYDSIHRLRKERR